MRPTFAMSDLIGIFREGLVALIPVAERARIAWHGPRVYDPWEGIEAALFASLVTSVVDNAVPSLRTLPRYGSLGHRSYADLSFVTERAARLRGERLVFLRLTTVQEPFDTICLRDVGDDFIPTGRTVELPLSEVQPELAARTADGLLYLDTVEYID